MNINQKSRRKSAQRGLTIVELLVSMALGVVLMAGVTQVFVGMRQTDRTQEAVSRMQESGRFAFNFLAQDIRLSGYLGCASTMDIGLDNVQLKTPFPATFQPYKGLQGWEASGTGFGQVNASVNNEAVAASNNGNWLSPTLAAPQIADVLDVTGGITQVLPGTDVLKVWGAVPDEEGAVAAITGVVPQTVTVGGMAITAGDVLMLSDCNFVDWVQACKVGTAGANATFDLTAVAGCLPGSIANAPIRVGVGADVIKVNGTTFYIGKRGNVASNPPALFRRTLGSGATSGAAEELVEGIEDMQILYGENINSDFNNAVDTYVKANQVSDWSNVVSIRISILVQSLEDNLVQTPQSYVFNGVNYGGATIAGLTSTTAPSDGRLRRVFTSTINLRNRTF